MIDITKTRFVVHAYPDHRWSVQIVDWIDRLTKGRRMPDEHYRSSLARRNIVCARNFAIKNTALKSPSHYEHFVFIDRDVRPNRESDVIFEIDADVVSCQMEHRGKSAWLRPDSFHDSLWITSRRVLEAIQPPWFEWRYNEDKTAMVGCLCQSFRDKALAAGFSIAHGGWADHDRDGSWC